ncbi:hypothetical protein PRZ48_005433 [Zasmidium cellare]|uniref:Protein kinase domain-containing protein n=1 Tax=Zasmidium cellare TaxID=395010 RepID=A0ABR0ESQ9_ZASCE|nr:hypothetical protein PRZ48_005433 [Zasmidium cellare]
MATPKKRTRAERKKAEGEGGAVSPHHSLPSPKRKKGGKGKAPEVAPASPLDDEPEAEVESGASPALPGMMEDEGDEAGVEADKSRSKGKRPVKESRGAPVGKGKRPARHESSPRAVAGALPDFEEEDEGEAEGGEGKGGEEGVGGGGGGEDEDEDEVPEEPLGRKRPREHHQPGEESLYVDTRPAKKRHVGDASETTLTGAGESLPREESEDSVFNEHDRLLTLIAENKPASQPIEDYLTKYELDDVGAHTAEDWYPFPQVFNGNDANTLELKEFWRTCNTAPDCREFIYRALTQVELARDYPLAERKQMCLDMVHRHSSTDEDLWREAPGPERYLCDRFSRAEAWPLTYQALHDAWNRARAQLNEKGVVSTQLHAEFAALMLWAEKIFKHDKIYLAPTQELPDDTVENCIRHLRNRLRDDVSTLSDPLWNDKIRDSSSEQLRQLWDQRYDAVLDSEEMPESLADARLNVEWEKVQLRLADYDVPHRLRHRFSDFKSIADQSLAIYGELLLPPDPDKTHESEWPEAYLEELTVSVTDQSFQNHLDAWERAIAAANGASQQALQDRFEETQELLEDGVAMWRPDEEIPPSQDRVRRRTDTSLGFGEERSHLQKGDHWNSHSVLGTGGNGQARLWVKVDPSMKITDRIAVKEVFLSERRGPDHLLSWNWDSYWFGEIHNREPIEEHVPRMLENCEDHDNIVRCYGAAIYDKLCMYRLYSEYCPHGDLLGLIRAHRRAGRLVDENVFLALQDDKDGLWPGIPVPKLGDFGTVRESAPEDPRLHAARNTYGYRAPEMFCRDNSREPQMQFSSDVWAIGRVMHCLVHLIEDPLQMPEYTLEDDPALYLAKFRQPAPYSDTLMGSIWDCLHQDPDARERIDVLWTDIQGEVGKMESHRRPARKHKQPEPGEAKLLFKPDTVLQWT